MCWPRQWSLAAGVRERESGALFRTIEKYSPTLLIDEGESFLRENEELRGIYERTHTGTPL